MSWATSSMRPPMQRGVVIDFAVPLSLPDSFHNHYITLSAPINTQRNVEWKDEPDSVERGHMFESCYYYQLQEIKSAIIQTMKSLSTFEDIVKDVTSTRNEIHPISLQDMLTALFNENKNDKANQFLSLSRQIGEQSMKMSLWYNIHYSKEFKTIFESSPDVSKRERNANPTEFSNTLHKIAEEVDNIRRGLKSIQTISETLCTILQEENHQRDATAIKLYLTNPCKKVKEETTTLKEWIVDALIDFDTFIDMKRRA